MAVRARRLWGATPRGLTERGFVSSQAATSWERALISGNGKYGRSIYGQPVEEPVVLNHTQYCMPLNEPPAAKPRPGGRPDDLRRLLGQGDAKAQRSTSVELAKESWGKALPTTRWVPNLLVRIGAW